MIQLDDEKLAKLKTTNQLLDGYCGEPLFAKRINVKYRYLQKKKCDNPLRVVLVVSTFAYMK